MNANITGVTQSTTQERYTTDSVTSRDGTTIGYRQLGHGPGIVALHGAMESAKSHMQLAEALAGSFTVYLPDRRGRGMSGPYGADYSMQCEVEDLDALLTKTGAQCVFGVSAGGLICLQAALTLPVIQKVAVYEPALIVNHSISTAFLPRYDREIAEGNIPAALVTGMLGAQMGPSFMRVMPRWLLEAFTRQGMKQEDKTAREGDVTMRSLAPTLHYDFQLVAEMAEQVERFRALRVETLLLGGSKSPAYLKHALDALEQAIPQARRVEFPGLDHGGSSDLGPTNRSGDPQRVAQELLRFFA
ncbi:MAG TPA: alpha/beta hydrolase [Ktedonobacterales bacterium]|jgi:pimeloyl-ACP methyl ester carboxylesterase